MPIVSAIVTAASAIAGAVGATFTAISGFTVAGFSVGKALLQIGLAAGLQAVAGALAPRQQGPKPGAIQSELQIGGDIPRQVSFGLNAVKGQLLYAHTYAAGNSVLQLVIALSDGWCAPITRIRVNDVLVSIDGGGVAAGDKATGMVPLSPTHGEQQRLGITGFGLGGAAGASEPSMIVQYYDGRPSQPAPSGLIANSTGAASSPGTLAGQDRFAGLAYVVVTLYRTAANFDAIPDMLFEFGGYRCYDPRKDSTAGGSGAHRLATPSTWEPSNNPAVQIYNYITGIQSEGQVFMGVNAPAYDVMTDLFVAAANICDETVTAASGGTAPRYRSAHVVVAQDSDHRSQMAPFVQAMAGYIVERGGLFGCVAGAAQLPVATITDDDIIWDRGVEWSASKSRMNRFNEVYGQFTDPNAGWQANSYPPERSAGDLAYDGERLATSLDLVAVQSSEQAQRIARIRRRETRREASATLHLGFHRLWLEAGDWITWNSALFGTTRIYRIMSRSLNADDSVTLALAEIGNEVYSWTAADERPYIAPPTTPGEPPLASTVTSFAVQADVVADRSIIRATWTPITDTRIIAVIIEYRAVGTTQATRVRDDSPYDGVYVLDQPPTGVSYEFRATIVTVPPRLATWTAWVSLAAVPTIPFGLVQIENLSADLFNRVDQQAREADASFELLLQDAAAVRETVTLLDQQVSAGVATARVRDSVTTVAGDLGAAAQRITAVEAQITDPLTGLPALDARVTTAQNAAVTADGKAVAAQSSAVTAQNTANSAAATANSASTAAANASSAVADLSLATNAAFGGNVAGTTARFSSYANAVISEAGFQLLAFSGIDGITRSVGLTAYAGPLGRGVILGGAGAAVDIVAQNFRVVDAGINGGAPTQLFTISGGFAEFNIPLRVTELQIAEGAFSTFADDGPDTHSHNLAGLFGTFAINDMIFDPAGSGIPNAQAGRFKLCEITITGVPAGYPVIVQFEGVCFGQYIQPNLAIVPGEGRFYLFRGTTELRRRNGLSTTNSIPFQLSEVFIDRPLVGGSITYSLWYAAGMAPNGQGGGEFQRAASAARLIAFAAKR